MRRTPITDQAANSPAAGKRIRKRLGVCNGSSGLRWSPSRCRRLQESSKLTESASVKKTQFKKKKGLPPPPPPKNPRSRGTAQGAGNRSRRTRRESHLPRRKELHRERHPEVRQGLPYSRRFAAHQRRVQGAPRCPTAEQSRGHQRSFPTAVEASPAGRFQAPTGSSISCACGGPAQSGQQGAAQTIC